MKQIVPKEKNNTRKCSPTNLIMSENHSVVSKEQVTSVSLKNLEQIRNYYYYCKKKKTLITHIIAVLYIKISKILT